MVTLYFIREEETDDVCEGVDRARGVLRNVLELMKVSLSRFSE